MVIGFAGGASLPVCLLGLGRQTEDFGRGGADLEAGQVVGHVGGHSPVVQGRRLARLDLQIGRSLKNHFGAAGKGDFGQPGGQFDRLAGQQARAFLGDALPLAHRQSAVEVSVATPLNSRWHRLTTCTRGVDGESFQIIGHVGGKLAGVQGAALVGLKLQDGGPFNDGRRTAAEDDLHQSGGDVSVCPTLNWAPSSELFVFSAQQQSQVRLSRAT